MNIKLLVLIILISILFSSYAQQSENKIQWLSIKEALEKQKKEPRKIIMDVFTDWCGWCKYMDKTTFEDPNIIAYISANYYAVKFNAEGSDTVIYKNKEYTNSLPEQQNGRKPSHPLAISLLQGQLSYPNLVYFDDSSNVITALSGFHPSNEMQPMLIYFSENLYKFINLQDFMNDFKKTFTDSLRNKTEKVKWLTISEAIEKSKKEKRILVISLETDWCASCKIMDNITFNDSTVADYLNKNTYPIRFNATSRDTVKFNNYTFINENKEHPFHQFAVVLLNGKMKFPNIVFINENNELVSSVPGYLNAKGIEPIIPYFVSSSFKTQPWEEYLKTFKSKIK